jgi:hydroxymethylbilane synthase
VSGRSFVVGARGSRLALRQTEIVLDGLRAVRPGVSLQIRTIQTQGDRSAAPLGEMGGRGVFVIEIEQALLAGEIDIAVHSLKDLPALETAGLVLAALPPRDDPRDVLVARDSATLGSLRPGATVGTGSPRRAAQLLAARADLRIADIRGNVDTRLRKVAEGEYDAVVLAAAGLARLGWLERASQVFDPEEMLPAVGQGALAVQVRESDSEARALVGPIDHTGTRAAVSAERAFERRLGGGCHAAMAALGELAGEGLRVRGLAGDAAGRLIRGEAGGAAGDAESLGVRLAEELLKKGAAALLETTS